jgi:hypothetical protein
MLHVVASAPTQATNPTFNVEVVTSSEPGTLYVGGWAFDPDSPAVSLEINVYIGPNNDDGHSFLANAYRPDVHQHHGVGAYHGIDKTLTVRPDLSGPQQVWIVAHNAGSGEGPITIWHDVLTIGDSIPTGAVESSSSPAHRTVELKGWASDANETTAPVQVEAYVGGSFNTPGVEYQGLTANLARPDGRRGFSKQFTTSKTGVQNVYVYAKNVPGTPGADRLIDIVQVTIHVDTTPPETTITSAPKVATPQDVIRVEFRSNEPSSTFQCRWDAASWAVCPGVSTVSLTPGEHIIGVRAIDAAGNVDATPATATVVVSDYVTQPPPHGEPSGPSVAARTVKRKSRLRIDIGPDSASTNYRVVIQRKIGNRWRKVARVRTRGERDVVVVNLRRGKYRVVLPKGTHGPAVRSRAVRLKR